LIVISPPTIMRKAAVNTDHLTEAVPGAVTSTITGPSFAGFGKTSVTMVLETGVKVAEGVLVGVYTGVKVLVGVKVGVDVAMTTVTIPPFKGCGITKNCAACVPTKPVTFPFDWIPI